MMPIRPVKHLPPLKRGGFEVGETLLCATMVGIALMSLSLFSAPFRDQGAIIRADREAVTPLLFDDERDNALQAIYEIRLCAAAWKAELGSAAELYCIARIQAQYRELARTAR